MMIPLVILIIGQRVVELYIANRNRRAVMKLGAKEYGAEHYYLFFLLHMSWLAGWILESYFKGWTLNPYWYIWLLMLLSAQVLRYWCITSLGIYWNTRILVVPGGKRVAKGPYKFFRHPNYLAVAIEFISVPLLYGAVITAVAASVCNALLLLYIRIPAEEKALGYLEAY